MPSVRHNTILPLALVVGVLVVHGVTAIPGVAVGESATAGAAPQEPAGGGASLAPDR